MKSAKLMALMLSLLLILAAHMDLQAAAPAPAYVELNAVQLDQLVAPIALYPDPLVAQILTASTYPDQVAEADTWLNQNMNLPPDQHAAGANDKSWDPAVKGLTEFPIVLDTLAKNTAWTSQLGNAYYNQPGDVMNAIQAMRLQAQQLNVLVTTAQQRVVVVTGVIEIVPVNPAVIYVPYYNPWRVWGTLFASYPGFVELPPPSGIVWGAGIGFEPGIAVGAYAGVTWGFGAWAPAWGEGSVVFNNNTYISQSTTVINHGDFGDHDRGEFEHEGRGVPRGYRPCAHPGAARAAGARAHKPSAGHPAYGGHTGSAGRSYRGHVTPTGHPEPARHSGYGGRSASAGRSGSGSRSTSAGHSGYGSHTTASHSASGHSRSTGRTASAGHSGSGSRSTSTGRSGYGSRTAANRTASAGHSRSTGHTASAGHSGSGSRSTSASRSGSGSHAAASRSASARHSASASRTASAGRSASTSRSASAGRSATAGRSASASRPSSASRSASAGRPSAASHAESAGRSASAGHSASAGRSSGGHAGGRGR